MKTGKFPSLVLTSSIIAALGGLLFGFDTAVISGTTESLKTIFSLNDWSLGLTVSSALFGTILGAATIQYPANAWGRKPTLIFIAVLYFVSAIGSAFPWNWSSFLFFRFLGGIGVGGASVVSPLYTAEIAPPKNRGFLVALTQFNIVFGILLAYLSNFLIASFLPGDEQWRWMFGVEAVPAALFFVLLFLNPESPRWLITRNRLEEAKRILLRLVGDRNEADAEFQTIDQAISTEKSLGRERLFCWRYRFPVMLAICIAAFNQLSGINAILYYAPKVFLMTGVSAKAAMLLPTIIGLTNLVFTMLALFVIDRFGRRTLLYVGSFGYIISLAAVGLAFLIYREPFAASMAQLEGETLSAVAAVPKAGIFGVLAGLMVFIAAHAFGQGAVIWVFISEIFPNAVRAQGQALGSFVHWFLAAVVAGLFPIMLSAIGPANVFFAFCGFMILQLLWVIFLMPETKQIPLEEMQIRLGILPSVEKKNSEVA